MISGFITQKQAMESVYSPEGKRQAITALRALPLKVSRLKTLEKDGYRAIQVAYGPKSHKEFAPTTDTLPELNAQITVDTVFKVGDLVDVSAKSKGRGFAGVIKRYGFHRQPVTGGQSDRVRAPGAIGAQTPGKVIRGKKMPGHYGNAQSTVMGLTVTAIDTAKNLIYVSGSVPGHFNSWVLLRKKS